MEFLTYSPKTLDPRILNFKYSNEKWFGSVSFLKSEQGISRLDTSLEKQVLSNSLREKKYQKLKASYEIAGKKSNLARKKYEMFKNYKEQFQKYSQKKYTYEKNYVQMNKAAVVIQKHVKGYLTRKKYESEIINFSRNIVNNKIKYLEDNDKFLLFSVGKKSIASVLVLQKFFRNCLFSKKLEKLRMIYYKLEEIKDEIAVKKLGKYVSIFCSKILIEKCKEFRVILEKLHEIKMRLALIRIRKWLKRRKLRVKTIRQRVKRYSKKYNTQNQLNNSTIYHSNYNSTPSAHVDRGFTAMTESKMSIKPPLEEDHTHILETTEKKLASIEINSEDSEESYLVHQKIREKIEKGMIACGLSPKKKSLNILPLFFENDPLSRPQTTRSTVTRMNLAQPLRLPPKPLPENRKKKSIIVEKVKNIKKYSADEVPKYMFDTKNSTLRYQETPSPDPVVPRLRIKNFFDVNTVMNPTFSFTQRTRPEEIRNCNKFTYKSQRPSTGPASARKKITNTLAKSQANIIKSDINIVKPGFDPSVPEYSELETQAIRPFYVKIRPGLERLKQHFNSS